MTRFSKGTYATALLLVLGAPNAFAAPRGVLAKNATLARVTFETHSLRMVEVGAAGLESLTKTVPYLDVWRTTHTDGKLHVEMFQSKAEWETLNDTYPQLLSNSRVVSAEGEAEATWSAEHARLAPRLQKPERFAAPRRKREFFDDYRTYAEIELFMDVLLLEHPGIVRRVALGTTVEGREIWGLQITGSSGPGTKPSLYLQGSAHANEWLGTMATINCAVTLVEGYGTDAQITRLMDSVNFYVVPVLNVDGYLFTFESNRNWRKNRADNGGGVYGVDLNRNCGPQATWCTAGSSTNPSSNTYCGPSMFSEPEDRAMADFIQTSLESSNPILTAVDFHTFGSLILWPYQWSTVPVSQPDLATFEGLGMEQQTAINSVNNGNFVSQPGVDLYAHSGGFIDYNFDENGVLAFTYEGSGNSHVQPASAIIPSCDEQWAGVLQVAEYTAALATRHATSRKH